MTAMAPSLAGKCPATKLEAALLKEQRPSTHPILNGLSSHWPLQATPHLSPSSSQRLTCEGHTGRGSTAVCLASGLASRVSSRRREGGMGGGFSGLPSCKGCSSPLEHWSLLAPPSKPREQHHTCPHLYKLLSSQVASPQGQHPFAWPPKTEPLYYTNTHLTSHTSDHHVPGT